MAYYLYRPMPIADWHVMEWDDCTTALNIAIKDPHCEITELSDCHWWSEAQAVADRLNGKGEARQRALGI